MKTITLVALIFFASCSSEDPAPKFDCGQLKKDSDNAHAVYQAATKVTLLPNAADYEVKKWQDNVSTTKAAYVDAYKLWSTNCK